MAAPKSNSVPVLFRKWRGGDAASGQEMAQRFSDWYYAITVARLGESEGRAPLQQACEEFANSIVKVNSSSKLITWAHDVITQQLEGAGARNPGGDFPNALTNRRSPTEMLENAASALPPRQIRLLAHTYNPEHPLDALIEEAEQSSGFPLAILEARRDLKRWLKDEQDIAFEVVPEDLDPDAAPLPLYEGGRLSSPREEALFERWMLVRFELCRDIAEFSAFAMAIRAGALDNVEADPAPAPVPPEPPAPRPANGHHRILVAEVVMLAILVVALIVLLIIRLGA